MVSTGFRYPSSMAELKVISGILGCYTTTHRFYVLLLFCFTYIYKQTFAIPGSVFLVSFETFASFCISQGGVATVLW